MDPRSTRGGPPGRGEVLAGKYRIGRTLGSGGMGVVVEAEHLVLAQRVAIKFLHADSDGEETAPRLLREARAAAAIRSEHVVRVLDVCTLEGGEPYLVMEWLDGEDLGKHRRRRGPLPIAEAVDRVLQACVAIAEAHAAGIVHRDLKPANLFLTVRADGSPLVKVLDFGISKPAVPDGQDAGLTRTGTMLGSPRYMSPEQLRDPRSVDGRTDVWALGVILHELLSGRPPFDAELFPAVLAQIAADDPQPLRAARPDVPAELAAIVRRCLEKRPSRRVQSVAELAANLAPFAPPETRALAARIACIAPASAGAASVDAATPADDAAGETQTDLSRTARRSRTRTTWATTIALALTAGSLAAVVSRTRFAPVEPASAPVEIAPAPPPPAPEVVPAAAVATAAASPTDALPSAAPSALARPSRPAPRPSSAKKGGKPVDPLGSPD